MAPQGTAHICPECKTPQVGDSPFCESCGYRLRSQETALEGLPAISPAQLERASAPRRPHTEQEPMVVPAQLRGRTNSPSHTFVEGLPAVPKDAKPAPPEPAIAPSPAETSPRPVVPAADVSTLTPMAPPPKSTLSWLAPLIGGLMLGGILGTAFSWLAAPAATTPDTSEETPEAQPLKKLAFPAGSFTKGLDEPTRARMLRLCYKLSDDSDKECEQDTLLRDEYPQIEQKIAAFLLDSVEVTHARYARCVEAGACTAIDYKSCQVHTPQGLQISLRVPKSMRAPDSPIVCLTQAQARDVCTWSKGRLPTHDEWEYAARGSRDARLFPWGDSWDPTLANWGERDMTRTAIAGQIDGQAWTSPVGVYETGSSPFGVYDMAGNVAEWIEGNESSPQARGGSWISPAYELRVTKRFYHDPDTRRTDVGVRCAYD